MDKLYGTDISDAAWALIEPHLVKGRKRHIALDTLGLAFACRGEPTGVSL